MEGNRYRLSFDDDGCERIVNFSKEEAECYYPLQVHLLENSPCTACNVRNDRGDIAIEKVEGKSNVR
jgi:hypothetical protein